MNDKKEIDENYDVMKVEKEKKNRLKIEWVYGYRGSEWS